jgi:hypothetical protein
MPMKQLVGMSPSPKSPLSIHQCIHFRLQRQP